MSVVKKLQSNTSSLWITGTSRTGKTSRLVTEFCTWVRQQLFKPKIKNPAQNLASAILVFAANNQNRRQLSDRLVLAVEGTYPVVCKTPVGFITDEVMLFFPLIFEELNLKAQFPLRLRPETEQELATQLWRKQPDWQDLCELDNEYRLVRQTLDLMQLAGSSGVPTEDISEILHQGLLGLDLDHSQGHLWQRMGELLLLWRSWCLERGLLTYGLIYELYWRYLLPNPNYQQHLKSRYQAIFADDVDDYPAIARDLFEVMLDQGASAVFTYNSDGKIRLGLNADPDYLQGLATCCDQEQLTAVRDNLAIAFADTAVDLVNESAYLVTAPDTIQSLQTISRAELLRQTAEIIIQAVSQQGPKSIASIDPVRAGLIADYCYKVDTVNPCLAPIETFPRWDRLGHQATQAYQEIVNWIEVSKIKQQQQSFFTPTILLAEAIEHFLNNSLNNGSSLSSDKLAILRELMETAQHFWEVDRRLRQSEPSFQSQSSTVAQFIQLLRRGTITANPRPLKPFSPQIDAVTLSTVFQYRSLRSSHPWQFWLDASSPLWSQGGAATLFAAPLFLRQWHGKTWMPEDEYNLDKERLERILRDVLARASTKIFLCHSDLGVNGTEQAGALLPLVHAAKQYVAPETIAASQA